MTQMLYKAPGPHEIHGGKFDYIIVDEDGIKAAQKDGWCLTTDEAAGGASPTREELEAKATELGIKFDGRTGDNKLGELIADKLK